MVRYIDSDASARSHIARLAGDEVVEDAAAIEPVLSASCLTSERPRDPAQLASGPSLGEK